MEQVVTEFENQVEEQEDNKQVLKGWHLYIIITLVSVLSAVVFDKFILSRQLYAELYAKNMEEFKIDIYYNFMRKLNFLTIIFIPLFLWIKLVSCTLLFKLPLMVKGIIIPFKDIYRVMLIATFSLLLSNLINITWIYFTPISKMTQETFLLAPLSITYFLDPARYSTEAFALLNKINIFEILWIYLVYLGFCKTKKLDKTDAFILALSYWIFIEILNFALGFYLRTLV